MIKTESEKNIEVCDLKYLTEVMGGKKSLIREIMDVFLKQVPEELRGLNEAIEKKDYAVVKNISHTMKSSVSIMGISLLAPVLLEMENMAAAGSDIEKIKELNQKLGLICSQAIREIEAEKLKYV